MRFLSATTVSATRRELAAKASKRLRKTNPQSEVNPVAKAGRKKMNPYLEILAAFLVAFFLFIGMLSFVACDETKKIDYAEFSVICTSTDIVVSFEPHKWWPPARDVWREAKRVCPPGILPQ